MYVYAEFNFWPILLWVRIDDKYLIVACCILSSWFRYLARLAKLVRFMFHILTTFRVYNIKIECHSNVVKQIKKLNANCCIMFTLRSVNTHPTDSPESWRHFRFFSTHTDTHTHTNLTPLTLNFPSFYYVDKCGRPRHENIMIGTYINIG